jgi:hypothetical protein
MTQMKPYGLGLELNNGGISFVPKRPTAAEDAVWEAVQAAINCGMTPRQFRIEAASAWEDALTREAKDAAEEMMK